MTKVYSFNKKFDITSVGLSYKIFSSDPALNDEGGLARLHLPSLLSGNDLSFSVQSENGELAPVGSYVATVIKVGVGADAVDGNHPFGKWIVTNGVSQLELTGLASCYGHILPAKIQKIQKKMASNNIDYIFEYSLLVEDYKIKTSGMVDFALNPDLLEVSFLDYEHRIVPVDKNGVTSVVQYYFDNSAKNLLVTANYTNVSGAKTDYWNGTLGNATTSSNYVAGKFEGVAFVNSKYPIIDFFDSKFTQTLENDAIVWVRRKAAGGTDSITYKGATGDGTFTTGTLTGSKVNYGADMYYISTATGRSIPDPTSDVDFTPVQAKSVSLPSTTARFIGWPTGEVDELANGNLEVPKKCTPFFFLKPENTIGVDGADWDSDTQKTPTWFVNGAHQVSPANVKTILTDFPEINISKNAATSSVLLGNFAGAGNIKFTGAYDDQHTSGQRTNSIGGAFVPGDGNEFYNMRFYRNDGVKTLGAVTLTSRQGLKFENCTFQAEWDGRGKDITTANGGIYYQGTSTLGPSIDVTDCYDLDFVNCNFVRNSYMTQGVTNWPRPNDGGIPQVNPIVMGADILYGGVASMVATNVGNLKLKGCSSNNNYGQNCYDFSNVDNLDLESCSGETYYHGTGRGRASDLRPMGYKIDAGSTSVWLKGCSFYGEGVGFYFKDLKDMVYPMIENCSAVANGEEAFWVENVNYMKMRNCNGETISKPVYYYKNSLNASLFNCTAQSDTGVGFNFDLGSRYWRTNDCHILSGSGLSFDVSAIPGKIDFGTFIQTSNSLDSNFTSPYVHTSTDERSLIGIKLHDYPYKATFRNLYFKGVKNDIDIDKGPNVELYLENSHFTANKEIQGEYNSPAYFIHKGFSGVWEYRDIGGSITTSAVRKMNGFLDAETVGNNANYVQPDFSLSFKSSVNNELGRPSITLGNSNEETQYLELKQGWNKISVYLMGRLLDVENPLTDNSIWMELKYKDRAPGDPHISTATTRSAYNKTKRLKNDTQHQDQWMISGTRVPDQKAYKMDMYVKAGQDCSCPLTICYEYYTTIGEIYVSPYARVVNFSNRPLEASTELSDEIIARIEAGLDI